MIRRPPRSTRTDTRFPYTTLFRSIGIGRAARGSVAGELGLVALDQVLGLTTRAVERVVDVPGRSCCQRGDDIADVHAQRAGLDPCNEATLALPGLCPIAGLGIDERSAERREGEKWVRTCRSRWWPAKLK